MKGFNSKNQKVEDLDDAGIVDPANAIINSVKNAISVSATALTADSVVLLPRDESSQMVDPRMMMN